jgi:porphobilinogen deaminase
LFSLDGKQALEHQTESHLDQAANLGKKAALHILEKGGTELMQQIKRELK